MGGFMSVPCPFPLPNASPVRPVRIRRILRAAGFTFDAVKARLRTEYPNWIPVGSGVIGRALCFSKRVKNRLDFGRRMLSPPRFSIPGQIANYLRNRTPKDQLDVLIRLFLFIAPVDKATLLGLFTQDDLDALAAMQLIRDIGADAICDLALFECDGLFLATDAKVRPPLGVNCVMPLLADSFEFVGSVSRKPVNSALDLCTGSGVHALAASRHAGTVVAADINPRASRFSEFNAWFNGVTNVQHCEGDLYGAIGDRTFDLIIANPPYMPVTDSTPNENFYCGGRTGDVLWSAIVRGLEQHLRPGGLCQMIHMIISFDLTSHEHKIRRLLGQLSDRCSVILFSNPIRFRSEHIAGATSVEFGLTTIKRYDKPAEVFYVHAPFRPPLPFDVSDLFSDLERASSPSERDLICQRRLRSVELNG